MNTVSDIRRHPLWSGPSSNIRGGLPGGRVVYVGTSGTGAAHAGGGGVTPDATYATLSEAATALVGRVNYGDVVYVMPGYTDSVDAADWLSEMGALAGASILGLGSGTMRPTLTWTTATSSLLLDQPNIELAGFNLNLAGPHATGAAVTVAAPITVDGVGCRVCDNFIYWGFEADRIVGDGITWNAARGAFLGNTAIALVAAVPTNSFMALTACDHMEIAYNYIHGPTDGTTRGVIYGVTTASIHVNIHHNYLHNILGSSTIAMSLLTGSTGEIAHNMCSVESGILPFTASIGRWHQNYCVDTEGQAGALVGTASS